MESISQNFSTLRYLLKIILSLKSPYVVGIGTFSYIRNTTGSASGYDCKGFCRTEDAAWSKTTTVVAFGEGAKDRHYIHWKSSGFNQGRTDGKDQILPGFDKAHLKTLGYTKIKVKVEFYYRVDDWGTQLIKLYNNQTGATLGTPAQHEWDERGWSWGTEEFVFSLDSTGDGGEFWILWDLAKDENQSDTWYVGGTTVTITAIY